MNCGESGLADVKTSGVVPSEQRGGPPKFSGMCYFLQFKKFKIKKNKKTQSMPFFRFYASN